MTSRKKFLTVCIVLLFAVLVLVSISYYLYFSPRFFPVIEGKVYRSAQLSDTTLENLIKEKGIKTILNLRGKSADAKWYAAESKIAGDLHIKLINIRLLSDELPRYRKLAAVISVLENAEKPLLIHCKRGADRSGLVSALALILETDLPLPEVKKQFSARYGVFTFYRSAGPYFFSMYEDWLAKSRRTHNRETFIHWINDEYRDSFGNLEVGIDEMNGANWNDLKQKKFMIPNNARTLHLTGWAFDASTSMPPENMQIAFGNNSFFKVTFNRNRSDVARYFKLGEKLYENFMAGWEAVVNTDRLAPGCHPVTLRYLVGDMSFTIPTETTVCR